MHPEFFLHAFSTPVTSILLNCELLQQEKLSGTERDHCLDNIRRQHLYLQKLVNKTWLPQTSNFLLKPIIAEVITRHHRPFADEYVYGFLELPLSLSLHGNALTFQEMLCCLLRNSLDSYSSGRKKKAILTAKYAEGKIWINVSDGGQGWSRLNQWQTRYLSRSHKKNYQGLGWQFCRNVVLELGGKLSISSQSGAGTTITITLEPCIQSLE